MRRLTRFQTQLLALFVVALAVRLFGLDWDEGHNFHPDERRIAEAVTQISFHPLQLNPHFFAYGSLPIYVTKVVTSTLSLVKPWLGTYDAAVLCGRALSAVWGAATVVLLVLLGRRLYGERAGMLAGVLLAGTVLHLQNSHFATSDIPLTCLVTGVLLLLVRAVQSGRTRELAGAGGLIGLALATKVSAAPLLLPLALAVLARARIERRLTRPLLGGLAAGAAIVAGFALAEPYAIFDLPSFLHDVREQSQMVRHAGLLPYTNQYMDTPKVIYDLREMVVWGMGPLLGAAALVGAWRRVRAAWRTRQVAEWLVIAWVVPFFAITASFDVKFPRYLLPIYPPLVLFGAAVLQDWAERSARGLLARRVVVAGTLVWALAFLAIYTRPHTEVTASRWFYDNVPAGTKVVTQDWDEGFPLPLPDRAPERYRIVPLAYYEPDSPTKAATLGRELASSEFLVLQTKRLYGAITQAARKFPLTDRYFHLLFAGDLGYSLVQEFASRPGLLGIEVPSELADESFSVYDHPRALIFRNIGHLTADELTRRIDTAMPSRLLSRRDMLLALPAAGIGMPAAAAAHTWLRSSPLATLLVAGLVELLGLAAFAVLCAAGLPRRGLFAFARVAGCLLFAYPLWLAASLGLTPFSQPVIVLWAAALVAAGVAVWRRGHSAFRIDRREVVATEVVVWSAFAFFLVLRALNPDVYWGEKPMDFSFLNVLYRTTTLPPPEPWFAGSPLNYTYFGHFLVAALGKGAGIDPALMFNLGIAVAAALTAAALFAAGSALAREWRGGVAAVLLTLVVGNLSGPRELAARHVVNFDYFWATSRVVPGTINEYPFWSLVFADLHAHVMVMPFTVGFVTLLLVWRRRRPDEGPWQRLVMPALGALFLGTIAATSGWSAPTFVALLVGLLGLDWLCRAERSILRRALAAVRSVVLPAAFVIGGAFLVYLPFWRSYTAPPRNLGWEVGPYAKPADFLTIFGTLLVLIVPYLFVIWRRLLSRDGRRLSRPQRLAMTATAVLLAATLVDWPASLRHSMVQAPSVAPFGYALAFLALALAVHPRLPARHRTTVALSAFALLVTSSCEIVFVWDRMNTLFKFYLDSWLVLGIAASFVAWQMCRGLLASGRWDALWKVAAAVALAAGLFTSLSGAVGALRQRHANGPRWTLDGTAYLKAVAPNELAAFDWLNRNVAGTPVIAEAYGPSYQDFARVSMNTGLPTVLGWDYHVFQRGQKWPDINWRKHDLETIYTSTSEEEVATALRRYRVSYLYLGRLERSAYSIASPKRFAQWSDLLTPVYRNNDVTIFAVGGRVASSLPVPTPAEARPAPPAEEASQDAPGHFRQPRGVACDAAGNVYVADFGNNRIAKLDGELKPLLAWGRRGSLPGELKDPCGLAIGPDTTLFVSDTWNSRVQVFGSDGTFLREWKADLYGARGIAVDARGAVFVADTGNAKVVRFSPAGVIEAEWGGRGSAPGKLDEPTGIAVDGQDRVWVCDNGNARVQVFDRDGTYLRSFPVPGWRKEVFSEPSVAIDRDGAIWVTVPLAGQVREYTAEGKLLRTVSGPPAPGRALVRPVGVALAPGGRLIVTDIEDGVVALAVETPVSATPPPTPRRGTR